MNHTALFGRCAIVLFAVLVIIMFCRDAAAIPAFARKYKTTCTTCHVAIPKRNAFGEAFRRNGYFMPDQEKAQIKQDPIELGAETWKEVFPNTIWPGLMPAEFPIAAYVHQRFITEYGASKSGNQIEFDMPHELELLFGGTFDKTFSFFGEFVLFEHGENAIGLKRFFFQLNDLVGTENAFNIRLGRIEPGITEGLVDNQRVMLEHATTLDYKATGKWRPRDQQSGIEINGIVNHRYQYAIGVVNGEGKVLDDRTDEKDFYSRLAIKFGRLGLDGYRSQESAEPRQTEYWMDNSITAGVYIYYGSDTREDVSWIQIPPTDSIEQRTNVDNDFVRYGIDLHLNRSRLDFYAGVITGDDNNPNAMLAGTENQKKISSTAWFGETYYLMYPWLIAGFRLGGVSSQQNDNDLDKYFTVSPNVTVLARENVRLTIESFIKIDRDKSDNAGNTVEADNSESLKWIKLNVLFAF